MARMHSRRTAKGAYWLAGKLSRIRTEQQLYKLGGEPAGKSRLPCKLSLDLLVWSQHLDWDHWDHWACKHDNCEGRPCEECGGIDCLVPELQQPEVFP
jgi:hypothetical protein